MTDDANSTPTATKGSTKGGGKIRQFIRKNKTLSVVLGAGGLYFVYHELKKNNTGEEAVEGEVLGGGGSNGTYEGPVPLTRELSQEGVDEEVNRVSEELREERQDREEMERENEESHIKNEEASPEGNSPGELEGPTTEHAAGQSVTIHGRTFQGATGYRIGNTGQTNGGKKYIEYVITFPGRQEHWQFFTATGNWRQVNNSGTGPGSNKPPTNAPPKNDPPKNTPPKNKPKQKPKIGIGQGHPVSGGGGSGSGGSGGSSGGGGGIDGHPNAVRTANKCVNGGVGPHTAPAGYHLFCASDGYIWRAPNGG